MDSWLGKFGTRHDDLEAFRRAGWGSIPVFFPPGWQVTRVSPYARGPFPSKESGSVIGADRQRFGPSCVLLKRVPQGRTESEGIVLAANAGPRVSRGGVTLKRRCAHRPSVIYLIVNKVLSLSLSLSLSPSPSLSLSLSLSHLKRKRAKHESKSERRNSAMIMLPPRGSDGR